MKHTLFLLIFMTTPIACMETVPNEVVRMFLEHMTHKQRTSVARVSKIWNFLINTFPIPERPPKRFDPTFFKVTAYSNSVEFKWKKSTNPINIFLGCSTIRKYYTQIEKHLEEQEQPLGNIGLIIDKNTSVETIRDILEERKNVSAIKFNNALIWKPQAYGVFFELFKSYPQVNHIELTIFPEQEDLLLDHFAKNSNIDSVMANTYVSPSFLSKVLSRNTRIKQIKILGFISQLNVEEHIQKNNTLRMLDCSSCYEMSNKLVKELIEAVQNKPSFSLILGEDYKSQNDNAQNVEFVNPFKDFEGALN